MSRRLDARAVALAGHTGDRATAGAGLEHADPEVRVVALGALERLGALTPSTVATALTDPATAVRRRAAELAATHPGVDLLPALHDPEPAVVEVAAWACGEHVDVTPAVLDRLIELTTDADDPLVRESAAAALGAIGDDRATPAVLAACRDKPAIRRRGVLALAPFLDGPHAEAVRGALDAALVDRDWQVRQAAEDLDRAARGAAW